MDGFDKALATLGFICAALIVICVVGAVYSAQQTLRMHDQCVADGRPAYECFAMMRSRGAIVIKETGHE